MKLVFLGVASDKYCNNGRHKDWKDWKSQMTGTIT